MDRFFSTGRAAELKGVVSQTIRIAIRMGDLPAIEIEGVGGKLEAYVVAEADLKEWQPRGVGRSGRIPVNLDGAPPGARERGSRIMVRRAREE